MNASTDGKPGRLAGKLDKARWWARWFWLLATDRDARNIAKVFLHDADRLRRHSGALACDTRGKALAQLILASHVLEKGLSMPARRLGFGREAVRTTMRLVDDFEKTYGTGEPQADHAAGVIRTYRAIHGNWSGKESDREFWAEVDAFAERHPGPSCAGSVHWTKEDFFRERNSPFPSFAASRHTIRNYGHEPVDISRLRAAVALASTAPSACNRQYVRVHCVEDKSRIADLLALQNGNRGFGHLADKLLVVTADLEGIVGVGERNDLFTNGGMFLMSLSLALHYHGIGHCILNWSRLPGEDAAMRQILELKPSESVVALILCGEPPDEFDVAESPRKDISELFVEH